MSFVFVADTALIVVTCEVRIPSPANVRVIVV
jgi:hypothetical protein